MKNKLVLLFIIFSILMGQETLFSQTFGKNKVQYDDFDWHYIQSEHFDVYFYPGGFELAVFTSNVAESSYVALKKDFQYELADRVSIIVYKSHNDFQQTNVVDPYLPEGVGGVTELFKNRVVIPFEGNYAQFRHVIHHELVHAVMNDMLYGGSVQSLISGQVVPVPTWFAEGMSEYLSIGWDTRTDMIVRDATISGYLPPIQYLSYYLAYQGGASVFRYIAETYGHQKISELLHKIKGSFRLEKEFESALGIKLKDLSENWQKAMRKEYWPAIESRKETSEIARAITDHKEEQNYLNISPALSPNGDKMVYLSDREGKQSIYLVDVLENKIIKKLIEGESSVNFEDLNWLSPGMDWSPDGENVVFSAKAGDQDALYVYNLQNEEYEQFKFDLDGVYSAAWSPKGNEIAFVGDLNGASDIYIYNLKTEKLTNLTNDIFSDSYPAWSNDGAHIAFVSDRGPFLDKDLIPDDFAMSKHDYENTDIYILNKNSNIIERVTDTPYRESDPTFSPDNQKMMFVSDRSGVYNIYHYDRNADTTYSVTNLLTGAFQLNVDKNANTMAFASFFEGGWDIFTLKKPFDMEPVDVEKTEFMQERYKAKDMEQEVEPIAEADSIENDLSVPGAGDYSRYVFANLDRRTREKEADVELEEEDYKLDDGNYKVRNYKVKFTPDLVNGAAQYNTLWGFQGYTQLAFSDVLGNHKVFIGSNLVFDLRNSYLNAVYWYLPKRIDYGISAFHYANTYITSLYGLMRYRNYGISAIASRPFNKFSRIDFSLYWLNVQLEYLQVNVDTRAIRSILPGLQYVHDTSVWGMTGPVDGFRGAVTATVSPKYSSESPEFATFKTDLRKYVKISNNYSFAFRLTTGTSVGKDPQRFFLGGVSNWINRDFNGDIRINSIEDIYFSEFITPLRGARYYESEGNTFGMTNIEFRFPLIPYIQLGLPPIRLGNIQGVLFSDIGAAWMLEDHEKFRGVKDGRFKDFVSGIGYGARIYLFGLLLKYDIAWRYDLKSTSVPKHYLSLGIDF
ncbi:MAG: biopolymer transporter Tol [Caldithrix sp.]|nr:biopolymer transporter Tol [Caldithrix sp.]